MITIDNQEVKNVTIDGQEVKSITVDGVLAWSSAPITPNFYIEYETTAGTQYQEFTTGADLKQFIMDNKTTFINHCKVVAKLPEITSCYGLFYACTATSLDLSEFNTSNVTDMWGMFIDCSATSLDLSSFDTSNVTNMWGMFIECSATSINLSSFDTSNVTDMSGMFASCAATTLDLSSFDTSSVTNMYAMFSDCRATSIDLSSFDTSNVTDMSGMFADCLATSLDLSSFDTSNVTNMTGMFDGCLATTLDLSSFDTSNVTDMSGMFADCSTTTGYARTQADADRFNASSGKPAGLVFTVKAGILRHVQVGDDLSGKTIYLDFPAGFYSSHTIGKIIVAGSNAIESFVSNAGLGALEIKYVVDTSTYPFQELYTYGPNYVEYLYETLTLSSSFGTVTSINTSNPAYQYIKIES